MNSDSFCSKFKLFLLFIIICGPQHLIQAQTKVDSLNQKNSIWQNFTYDMDITFKSIGHSYTRPMHWSGKEWKTFGAVTGGTILLYLVDDNTSQFFRDRQESIPKVIKEYGTKIAKPEYNYMLTGGVYLTGLLTKDVKLRRTGVLLIASASSAGLLQQILKSVVGRARPIGNLGKDTFDPFNSNRIFHSFPSGHTILAFTNAYAIAKQFKNPWTKAGIYTLGLIPGISRIWDGQHWLSDVAFGVAISIFTVESIDRYLDSKYEEKYNKGDKKVSWNLSFAPGQLGVTARF